jgi:hypothetical protein
MFEAIIGLVGVIVGAGITTGYQHWRENREQERRKRLALREIFDELGWYGVALNRVVKDGDMSRLRRDPAPLEELWQQSRADLLTMDEIRWQTVRKAVRMVGRCAELASAADPKTPTHPVFVLASSELMSAADAICIELGVTIPSPAELDEFDETVRDPLRKTGDAPRAGE